MRNKGVLTRDCSCARCGQRMRRGEEFVWHQTTRSKVGHFAGGSWAVAKVPTSRPAHTDELCLSRHVLASELAAFDRGTREGVEYARTHVTGWDQVMERSWLAARAARRAELLTTANSVSN